ncbi:MULTISPECIES: 5'-methylthioadenosine/adenosylhomocysteine nucleosidase [Pontibacillus]|uniref:adenosylhomocysteine nucleosidase n=1 Tax=Pontibacillus chungwhensis TaxID=265426 RepID=A0ABY8V4G3_9BACI|nr:MULTISPECIES: 5'-methylthioadenosine/adenosylhomocysteine nucleosidase [Pontibacillus]MCD5322196.1 5'-methylthioadenosine/adenosylhomocysteine nucleosidase [Pontibacillus sp. HN14]WIF99490.1 5'-methylthioadenosine/adenosylhomocysteine nucleosidase [Pontibacillus chungwhensis]
MKQHYLLKPLLGIVLLILLLAGCSQQQNESKAAEKKDEERVGIIGPMEVEIDLLRSHMEVDNKEEIGDLTYYEGVLNGQQIVLVQSGIGKVNATIAAQTLISEFDVDTLINSGVAGGLHPDLGLGDIVISTETVHHDMDETAKGFKPGQIPGMDTRFFKADEDLIQLAKEGTKGLPDYVDVFEARIATGDQFIASEEKTEWIYNTFNAYVVEMEGAAVGQVAQLNNIPYVVIRSASDDAGEEAASIQENFVEEAAKNSSHVIEEILKNMGS